MRRRNTPWTGGRHISYSNRLGPSRRIRVPRRLTSGVLKSGVLKSEIIKPKGYSNLVEAFDAEYAGDFPDIGHDALELLAVGDFQGEVDPGMQIVGVAGEGADIRAGIADDAGDVRQHAGAILGA